MHHDDVDYRPDPGLEDAEEVDPGGGAAVTHDWDAVIGMLAQGDLVGIFEDLPSPRLIDAEDRPEHRRRRKHRRAEAGTLDEHGVAARGPSVRGAEPFEVDALRGLPRSRKPAVGEPRDLDPAVAAVRPDRRNETRALDACGRVHSKPADCERRRDEKLWIPRHEREGSLLE